jgi:hypothetical protein
MAGLERTQEYGMEHLTQQDFHTFLAFLSELYTVRDLDSFRRYLISALPQVVPSELTSYNEMHTTKGVSENWEEPANTVTRAMQ